jgi:hypothetical protein
MLVAVSAAVAGLPAVAAQAHQLTRARSHITAVTVNQSLPAGTFNGAE